jgi:hypothetical protein
MLSNKNICKYVLTFFVISLLLVPIALSAPADSKLSEKDVVIDNTKKGLIDFDSESISGIKISDDKNNHNKYIIEKSTEKQIKISHIDTVKDGKKEHVKVNIQIPVNELEKIDIDKDGIIGVLRTDDGVVKSFDRVKIKDISNEEYSLLVLTLSETVVDGYSGYTETTFTNVPEFSVLIPPINYDISSATMKVTGNIPPLVNTTYPTDHLWASYPFDDGAVDTSGNGHNGSVQGGMSISNGVATFDSIDDHIMLPNTSAFNNSFTFAIQADPGSTTAARTLISYGKPSTSSPYNGFRMAAGTARVSDDGSTAVTQTYTANQYNNWYVWTYDGSYLNSYLYDAYSYPATRVAAASTSTVPYIGQPLNGTFSIGKFVANPPGNYYYGDMKDVVLYTDVLTNGELIHLSIGQGGITYNAGHGNYRFDHPSGTTVELDYEGVGYLNSVYFYNTNGTTDEVVLTQYFTRDIEIISNVLNGSTREISISHFILEGTPRSTNGTITFNVTDMIGEPILYYTNNENASLTFNETHFVVHSGYVPTAEANTYLNYTVNVPVSAGGSVTYITDTYIIETAIITSFVAASYMVLNKFKRRKVR